MELPHRRPSQADRRQPNQLPSGKGKERVRDSEKAETSTESRIARQFNSLNDSQRSTLLDLYFGVDFVIAMDMEWDCQSLSEICEWLSIVQNRKESAIFKDARALKKMKLVSIYSPEEMGESPNHDGELQIDLSGLNVDKEFFEKVVLRNPTYDTRLRIQDKSMATFDATCAPSRITVLDLHNCKNLEVVDLSGFPKLRCLYIRHCPKLREIIGCEGLEGLGLLWVFNCPSYDMYPPLQKLQSLREFCFYPFVSLENSVPRRGGELDVSECVHLRKMEIHSDGALSSIRGLEGLRSLTRLRLNYCTALESLPDIGHMSDLTELEILGTAVEEIKGVEKLSSLKSLTCAFSKLKTLPDLSHLPHLEYVSLRECPVTKDPSSAYYGKSGVSYRRNRFSFFHPETFFSSLAVSDASDSEQGSSEEEF